MALEKEIVVSARLETDAAVASAERLRQALERLNSTGTSSGMSGLGGKPAGAPADAPNAPDPLGGFGAAIPPPPQLPPQATIPGFAGAAASPTGAFAPGAFAPPAPGVNYTPGGGAAIPPPFGTGFGGGALAVASVQIIAQNVQIVAQNVQGGGAGGVGGGGPGGGGGQPPPPPPQPSMGGFWQDVAANPTPAGLAYATMARVPLGPAAAFAAGAQVVSTGMNAYLGYTNPGYNLDTALMAARTRGEYVAPEIQAAMRARAELEGRFNVVNEISRGFESVPIVGGIFSSVAEVSGRRDWRRALEMSQAQVDAAGLARRARALGTGYGPRIEETGQLAIGAAESLGAFGSGAMTAALGADYRRMANDHGASEGDILGGIGVVAGIAGRAEYGDIYRRLAGGTDPTTMGTAVLPALIAEGNLGAISAMRQAGMLSPREADRALGRARGALEIGNTLRIGQANVGVGEAALATMRVSGAGYMERAGQIAENANALSPIRAALTQRLQLAANEVDRAQIRAEIAQVDARIGAGRYESRMEVYSGNRTEIDAYAQMAQVNTGNAMFGGGSEASVLRGFGEQRSGALMTATLLDRMASDPLIAPEQRRMYAAQAAGARQQANVGIAREAGGFSLSMRMGEIGVAGEMAAGVGARAALFGDRGDVYGAAMGQAAVVERQIGVTRGQLGGAFGPLSGPERLEAEGRLTALLREHAVAVEQATRSYVQAGVQIAQTAGVVAGARQSRAQMLGVGGVEGFGYAQRSYEAFEGVSQRAAGVVADLRARGVDEDNPAMQAAVREMEQAQTSALGARIGRANVPFSIGLQRQESSLRHQIGVMSQMPFGYGSLRAGLQNLLGVQERQSQEIVARRDAHRRSSGGRLTEAEEFAYEQQLQAVGQQQAGTFSQLSTGWESRLISMAVGTPGNFDVMSPSVSFRAAVGAGVVNPHMGVRGSDLPFFMRREGGMFGSYAGATGTPEGFAATALTDVMPVLGPAGGMGGGNGAARVRVDGPLELRGDIVLHIPLPGGGTQQITGTASMSTAQGQMGNNHVDTSPDALGEFARAQGIGVPRQ